MKKFFVAMGLLCAAMGALSMPCRAQEIVLAVPACGLWQLDQAQIEMLGDFETVAITLMPAGTVVWLDGRPLRSTDTIARSTLAQIQIFSTTPRPALGISPLYTRDETRTAGGIKIRCINPVF